MQFKVLVKRYDTWTEVLNFLLDIRKVYSRDAVTWISEVWYIEETDDYKIVIKVKI